MEVWLVEYVDDYGGNGTVGVYGSEQKAVVAAKQYEEDHDYLYVTCRVIATTLE